MPRELIDEKSMGEFKQELEDEAKHGPQIMALFCVFVKAGKSEGRSRDRNRMDFRIFRLVTPKILPQGVSD